MTTGQTLAALSNALILIGAVVGGLGIRDMRRDATTHIQRSIEALDNVGGLNELPQAAAMRSGDALMKISDLQSDLSRIAARTATQTLWGIGLVAAGAVAGIVAAFV